ncbi:MAG: hypothetical protein ACJAT7_003749 [Psychromonas sp.]|jgi:hypothetical protein|uniref:hypothetical protein n=1 Tax=Psychromonas sp. TaxID=1884585 RepID=UPI0039E5EE92
MSNRQLEEQQESIVNQQLATVLGISIDELEQLDFEITPSESNDGLVYEYVVSFAEFSDQSILDKIEGLNSGNYVYLQPYELETDPYEEELTWDILSSKQFDNFLISIKSAKSLLNSLPSTEDEKFQFLVMLHAHIVASVEAYLSSTFIHSVTKSDLLIRKIIETDPHFKAQTIQLNDIYSKQENIKNIVGDYLKGLIFHKIKISARLYKSVLNVDFGDIKWLTTAISMRHHCTHRGGYDEQDNKINVTTLSISELIINCILFCQRINSELTISTKL